MKKLLLLSTITLCSLSTLVQAYIPQLAPQGLFPVTIFNNSNYPIIIRDQVIGATGSFDLNRVRVIRPKASHRFIYPEATITPTSHIMTIYAALSATRKTNHLTIANPSGRYYILSPTSDAICIGQPPAYNQCIPFIPSIVDQKPPREDLYEQGDLDHGTDEDRRREWWYGY